jgi:hypothetical protein
MDTLTTLREALDGIISEAAADLDAQAAARAAALDEREKLLALALEEITVDSRVSAAWQQALQHRSDQVLALIDEQLGYFKPRSTYHTLLTTLRRTVAAL